jgi:dihydrofolate synthase/folylpolyglutamate synthase
MQDEQSNKFPPYWAVPFSSYEEVTDVLRELETACILRGRPSDGTVSFEAVSRCLHQLKRPDREYRSIHVTGTNGKTTVSRMIAALMQAGGMKVGLYTSPHLRHFRERIAINGHPISERDLVDACNNVKAFLDWEGVELSPFEFLTTAAFFAFRAAKVDYAVIEVGIGGRQDATNVIAPEVSVITNVDYDHMDLLGDTLEQIAAEKAGIIKPLTPLVCGTMPDGPRAVVLSRAAELKAPVLLIGEDYEVMEFVRTGYKGACSLRIGSTLWREVTLNSPAPFAASNAAHALAAYDVLRRRGLVPRLSEGELRTVFERVELAACCEVVPGAPTVVVDSAHNAPAAARLATVLRTTFEGRRTVLLVALSREKEFDKMIRHLADAGGDRAIFTRYPIEGAVAPQVLADLWRSRTSAAAEIVDDPEAAFHRAVQAAGSHGVVVVTGSTQLGGYCRPLANDAVARAAAER